MMLRKIAIAALGVLALASAGRAETTVSTSETTAEDGSTYVYTLVSDDLGTSTETLTSNGTLVAALYTDVEGNWTGQIGSVSYADQWSDEVGDYVVVTGADTWPTWGAFSDALYALPGWGGVTIAYDGDVLMLDLAYFQSATSNSSGTFSVQKARGLQQALLAGKNRAARARATLFHLWLEGKGAPLPKK